jgi:BirA family transcriptional regulator, biotin operon repressor / biotin---[acetyl-CoA-carboxylase] ligase
MIGRPRVHHRVTDSTSERAKRLALAGASHGTLVTADEQTAGRGRQGRAWIAPPGSALLMSLVVREPGERHPLLPLAAAVAVCEACERAAPVECRIKWPNDVLIGARKVAGILLEGRPQEGWAVVGIGLNVATEPAELPEQLQATATSLWAAAGRGAEAGTSARRAAGGPADREVVLERVLAGLAAWLLAPLERVLSGWRERDALRGERVRWDDGEGVAEGIDETGALLVETGGGLVALGAGEVHLIRAGGDPP